MQVLNQIRSDIRSNTLRDENAVLDQLRSCAPDEATRQRASTRAAELVRAIRADANPGLMELFLAEYGLSTDEGIALMCLAEALLRVPDTDTIDELIEDKIAPSAWGAHLGKSSSSLVNASTWALMLTGKVLQDGPRVATTLRSAVKRLGEPIIRTAVGRAMKVMGAQFVLGRTIDEAFDNGRKKAARGYTFSYDMLGEAALTARDATSFHRAYAQAIARLSTQCKSDDIRENPGISVKLSALHPRYETGQRDRVMTELVARTLELARQARDAKMGFNIDAEEANRLDLSLDVIEAVLSDPSLAGWDGFGVVVQAYGKRAGKVIDWLYALARNHDRKIMVRLVKGAYWDTEIKRAQVEGLSGYPVFTRKSATDVAYVCCAKKLLEMSDRIYPQFATHNAHSVAAILEMATDLRAFEFQRLHGMGEALHDIVMKRNGTRCRIYAPVGAHHDLLAYLVRRLLENGANSSFVNQIVDDAVPAERIAQDPFGMVDVAQSPVRLPIDLYAPERPNSTGWDLSDVVDIDAFDAARAHFQDRRWKASSIVVAGETSGPEHDVRNPANPDDIVGTVTFAGEAEVNAAIGASRAWGENAATRAQVLNKAADLYEENFGELFAVLTREAGKTPRDAVAELREAVDFLRYYAARATELTAPPCGVFTCISPWNFPLAIFTGQISAALAAGNGVLAKPAESTSIVASLAVELLHRAGVPTASLQLVVGTGSQVGAQLTSNPRIDGVCFTGSTATAMSINRAMAANLSPTAPLIAETGGINAMIVDSTALPEQAIRDIVTSAFQSAGQRCSALRMLYVQDDVAKPFLEMLFGAMDELVLGDPWSLQTDVGPVIDEAARATILDHIDAARDSGRILKVCDALPERGSFVAPTVIKVDGIADLKHEIFGPVLHVATFGSEELDDVVDAINATGYGLTFGMHSRIDDRIEQVTSRLQVGNQYINRNQIGAIVGSQPFGGEGLSGTGPKAGGPSYIHRFTKTERTVVPVTDGPIAKEADVARLLASAEPAGVRLSSASLPGPTGESNRLSEYGRGTVLCLGPTREGALEQMRIAQENGCAAVCVAPELSPQEGVSGVIDAAALTTLEGFDLVVSDATDEALRPLREALAAREGKIIPLASGTNLAALCRIERHICVDTTAAGGNASLLAQVD
ncbi:bifunctional proline dehydrogenase/L-glutamate gamma-semialdehyde dehydrogenase PutA [Celeribacter arenosi]|uniref:Bifunctional protein PutA n=1 Tax=Celeribacter arenosi TaxID=792649 RepID=A0ABP7KAG4_9RHOB